MNAGDLVPAAVWREEERTAAKRHTCSGCGGAIPIGLRYVVIASLCDGKWYTDKLHICCRDFLRRVQLRTARVWGVCHVDDASEWAEGDADADRLALARELAEIARQDVAP